MAWTFEFVDSFEDISSVSRLEEKWTDFLGSGNIPPTIGSGFTYSGGSLVISSGSAIFYQPPGSTIATNMVNTVVSRTSDADRVLFSVTTTAGVLRWYVVWRADGKMEFFSAAGVSQGVSVNTYASGTRHIIEFYVRRISSTNGSFALYKHGVLDRTWSLGVEVQGNRFYLAGRPGDTAGPALSFEHFILSRGGADSANPLGELSVVVRRPTGFGSEHGWSGSVSDINEATLNTGTYMEANVSTTPNHNVFTFGAINTPYNIIGAGLNVAASAPTGTSGRVIGVKRVSGAAAVIANTYMGNSAQTTTIYYQGSQTATTIGGYGTGIAPANWTNPAVIELGFGKGGSFFSPSVVRVYQFCVEVIIKGPPPVTTGWRVGSVGFG